MPQVKFFKAQIVSLKDDPVIREIEELTIQEQGNSFAILANHAPLLAYLPPQVKLILKSSAQTEEWRLPGGGILQVNNNQVIIFDSENK